MKKLVKVKVKKLISAICEKGHLQTLTLEKVEDFNGKLCTQCHSKVITNCTCGSTIKGSHLAKNARPNFTSFQEPQYIENRKI